MKSVRASVAMAVYNGEQYIKEQVDSVLERMGENDELVISYDVSKDNTKQIIDGYALQDSRVRVVENDRPGVRSNFNNAIHACMGEYIFLCDQDDCWIGDKINVVVKTFEETGADLVVHDGYMTDGALNPLPQTIFEHFGRYDNPIRNMIKCNYWGCCMAFRADLWKKVGPFPADHDVCHDHWLGVLAGFYGKIARVDECLMLHRLHDNNQSAKTSRPVMVVLKDRMKFTKLLLKHMMKR